MKNTRFFMIVARIIIICLLTACIFCMFLLSPYEEWDTSLKTVDYDVVDVEKAILLFTSTVNIVLSIFSRKSYKAFAIIHVILTIICLVRLSWLFTL